ncbi:MAG TPA: hypothetical protein VN541_12720 [Tepidisphaeraceae bacterium]|nr:hypothetical protein [Tepidisphaeraceae bacterium]
MNLTLLEEDRRAVDLLLDRTPRAGDGDGGQPLFASADPSIGQRVARAQQLLQLLEVLPQNDPPADLVGRTLRMVEQAGPAHGMIGPDLPSFAGSRPMA